MRLLRPYIPITVRIQVAERQLREQFGWTEIMLTRMRRPRSGEHMTPTKTTLLDRLIEKISAGIRIEHPHFDGTLELHHRPALTNRPFNFKPQDYDPPANDPEFLVYISDFDHYIETNVRGVGAQRSDLGQRRYNKKVARNRMAKDKKRPGRWPKRKLRSKPINSRWRRQRFG